MSTNRVQGTAQATQRATLPGLELPRDVTASQARFNRAVKEHLEVRQGARGNPYERGLTLRDVDARLQSLGFPISVSAAVPQTASGGGVATVGPGGTQTFIPFEALAEKLRSTKLFTDLTRRIDDPARFDDLPQRTRALLLEDIAQVRQEADASIRRVDDIIKTATESFAQTVTTVQANISQAAAGVRQVQFASASLNRATAGLVTTITARLDNFSGGAPGTATVESKMTAIADRATGLEAQYTLKVAAGGYVAGYGVASTTNAAGNATSAFIIQADKFAIVDSSYTGGLTNSPASQYVMFGVDGDGAYVKGNLKIDGQAQIKGITTGSDGNQYALTVNDTLASNSGGYFRASGSNTYAALRATGLSGARGIEATSQGAGGIAVSAVGLFGAVGLSVLGTTSVTGQISSSLATGTAPLAVTSTTLNTNLNADMVDGLHASSLCQIVVGNTGTATVAGTGLNLTTTVSGVTVTCSSNNIVIEPVSDARLKQDIEDESLGLGFIRQLRPRTYRMKAAPSLLYHGFLYQELAEVLPREGDALVQHRPDRYGGVDYNSLIAPLVLSVQQQDREVQALRARVAALESQLAA